MTTGASQRRNGGVSPAATGFVPLLDVGGFDRRVVLLAGENEALAALDPRALRRNRSVGVPRRTAACWRALSRLVEPLDAARDLLHHGDDVAFRRAGLHACAIVLGNCAVLGRSWWGWSAWDWARLAGSSSVEFRAAQPLPTQTTVRPFLRGLEPEPEADHRVSAVQALMVRPYRVRQVWCKSVCSVFSVVGLGC